MESQVVQSFAKLNIMEALGQRIAYALRHERVAAGLSVSELARRAGVSKATVSQIESGGGNPSVETLWALSEALNVPFAQLVEQPSRELVLIRSGEASGVTSAASAYAAALLSSSPPNARRDIYIVSAEPGQPKLSTPHSRGTTEHVVIIAGSANVGPAEAPILMSVGDYVAYAGDETHTFEALMPGTRAVLISEIR
jgi:transcriptional regulator with XRE-family HTH domain